MRPTEILFPTDFSPASLAYVRQEAARQPGGPGPVRLLERPADDWSGIEPQGFDAVILNSVAQYFPSLDYLLAVLDGAVAAVAPGGFVFLGDLRSLPLLEAFHASVELHQAGAATERRELALRVRRAVAREDELLLDPRLFPALRQRLPRLAGVEIHLPRGRHANELTKFRYDVVLRIGSEGATAAARPQLPALSWPRDGISLDGLRRRLAGERPAALELLDVPNARLAAEARLLAWLEEGEDAATVGDFLRQAPAPAENAGVDPVDPDALRDLAAELGYEIALAWSEGGRSAGAYDALLTLPGHFAEGAAAADLLPLAATHPDRPPSPISSLSGWANTPLRGRIAESLVPSLRSHLEERLPSAMVPAQIASRRPAFTTRSGLAQIIGSRAVAQRCSAGSYSASVSSAEAMPVAMTTSASSGVATCS